MQLPVKILKKAVRILIIFIFVTAVAAFCSASAFCLLGYSFYKVESDSMRGVFEAENLIITKKIQLNRLEIDDIIIYRRENSNMIVTHRIVGINREEKLFYTKGDRNTAEDDPVPEANILGIYVRKMPFLSD